ncbi:MAG: hypothetical protein JRI68_16060, partial [Deltaproteobacteria bacterium]|nr:hypothetical protein [Deltaproteobacteria bacterium]
MQGGDTPTTMRAHAAAGTAAGGLVAGKYRLERLIAKGGMGAVWQALDCTLDRP